MRPLLLAVLLLATVVLPARADRWPEATTKKRGCATFRVVNGTSAGDDGECIGVDDFSAVSGVTCTSFTTNSIVQSPGYYGTSIRFTDLVCTVAAVAATAGSVDIRPSTVNASNTFAATTIGLNIVAADNATTKGTTFTSSNTVTGGPFGILLQTDYSVGANFTDLDAYCAVCYEVLP